MTYQRALMLGIEALRPAAASGDVEAMDAIIALARVLGAIGGASTRARGAQWEATRAEVFERDGWACRYCGAGIDAVTGHCDHVVPFSRGGSDDPCNLVAACGPCNTSKGARTPDEWRAAKGSC